MAKLELSEYNKLLKEGRVKVINRTNPGYDTGWDSVILYALVARGVDDTSKEMFEAIKKQNLILMPNVYKEGTDITIEQFDEGLTKLRELFIEPPKEDKTETPTEPTPEDAILPTTPPAVIEPPKKDSVTPSVGDGTTDVTTPDKPEGPYSLTGTETGPAKADVTITVTTGTEAPVVVATEPPVLTQEQIDMKILMDAYREAILKKIDEVKASGIDSAVKEQYLKNLNEIIANDANLETYVRNAINTGQISQKKLQETIDRGRTIIENKQEQEDLGRKIEANSAVIASKGHPILKSRLKRENKRNAKTIEKLAKSNIKLESKQREIFLKAVEKDKKRLMRVSELQLEYAEAEAEEAKFAEVRDNSKFLTKAMAGRKAKKAAKRKTKIESKILDFNGPVKITGSREIVIDPRDYESELEAEEALVR